MSTISPTIEGSPISQSKTLTVAYWCNGQAWCPNPYTETFTRSLTPPVSTTTALRSDTVEYSWKLPLSDKSSFKAIKKSGIVKMTDYDVGKVVETYAIARLPRRLDHYEMVGNYTMDQANNALHDVKTHLFDLRSDYFIVGDLRSLSSLGKPYRSLDYSYIQDVDDAIQECMSSVVSELNSSFDALTEAAEIKSTLSLLKGILDGSRQQLHTFFLQVVNSTRRKENLKKLGNLWMQYRYGIMPLVYSVKDLLETLSRNTLVYITARKKITLNVNESTFDASVGSHFYETISGSITIRSVGKQKYSNDEMLRLADTISVNPFKTAWELIPLSFVVDWFVNVGDVIEAHTGSLMNFTSERKFCYTVKTKIDRCVYYYDSHNDIRTLSTGPAIGYKDLQIWGKSSRTAGSANNTSYLLHKKSEDSYSRRVFQPSEIKLRFDPFLNWKRYLDAYVLTVGASRSSLKKLNIRV